jgi:hypothetical protein
MQREIVGAAAYLASQPNGIVFPDIWLNGLTLSLKWNDCTDSAG